MDASSKRWMVEASCPVTSVNRLAARPVGAASTHFSPLWPYSDKIPFKIVVLPVPGPPVINSRALPAAERMACR